jgi:hypothetical protein
MTTVTMRKGDLFADIFDSLETIAQAQNDGYHRCTEDEIKAREALIKADDKKREDDDLINDELDIKDNTPVEQSNETGISLADLDRAGLLEFAGKRKLYDKSFKELEPEAIVKAVREKAYAKVLAKNLIPAGENLETITDSDLFTWFDSIGK